MRRIGATSIAMLLTACSAGAPSSSLPEPTATASPPSPPPPAAPDARWLPTEVPTWMDGTRRRGLVHDVRVTREDDGRLMAVHGDPMIQHVVAVPEHLGGGFVFVVDHQKIYRAAKFDGELVPACEVWDGVSQIDAHFKGFFVTLNRTGQTATLEWPSCQIAPPRPAGALAARAVSPRDGIALLRTGDLVRSRDGGRSYQRFSHPNIGVAYASLVVEGDLAVALGVRTATPAPPVATAIVADRAWRGIGGAVRGPDEQLLVKNGRGIEVVSRDPTKPAEGWRAPNAGGCSLFEASDGALLLCDDGRVVAGLNSPSVRVERDFGAGPFFVGAGRVIHAGACAPEEKASSASERACMRRGDGTWADLFLQGVEVTRWIPGPSDTWAAVGREGQLFVGAKRRVLSGDGERRLLELSAPGQDVLDDSFALLDDGIVVGAHAKSGHLLRIHPTGRMRMMRRHLVAVAWPHVLAFDHDQVLGWQSDNHGASFFRVERPPVLAREPVFRCSRYGCSVDDWVRPGWNARPQDVAEQPQAISARPPGPETTTPSAQLRVDCKVAGDATVRGKLRSSSNRQLWLGATALRRQPGRSGGLPARRLPRLLMTARGSFGKPVLEAVEVAWFAPFSWDGPAQRKRVARIGGGRYWQNAVPVVRTHGALPDTWLAGSAQGFHLIGGNSFEYFPLEHELMSYPTLVSAVQTRAGHLAILDQTPDATREVYGLTKRGSWLLASETAATHLGLSSAGELQLLAIDGFGAVAWEQRGLPRRLAGWETVTPGHSALCKDPKDAVHAVVPLQGLGPTDRAVVRWGNDRLCVDAVEVDEDEGVIVARYADEPQAARLTLEPGRETVQPLSCTLGFDE